MSLIHCGLVFDGTRLLEDVDLEIKNGRVARMERNLSGLDREDARDYFVMPGMVDAHIHLSGATSGNLVTEYLAKDSRTRLLRASSWLMKLLKAGFTTVRDCGEENSIYLREAVRTGTIVGPNILAAGKPLSQSFGHGEVAHSIPFHWNQDRGMSEICDGRDQCISAARRVLRTGADFIKVFSTGGVLSERDRPDQEQFTPDELASIVNEARKAGTYVAAHAHGDQGIRNAIQAGVKSIEHGTLAQDKTLREMAEKNVSLTPTLSIQELLVKHGQKLGVSSWGLDKIKAVREGIGNILPKAAEYGINILAGTDLGFETGTDIDIGTNWNEIILLTEIGGLTPLQALMSSTGNVRKIGIQAGAIEKGAPADIVMVEGNPVNDIKEIRNKKRVLLAGNELYFPGQ